METHNLVEVEIVHGDEKILLKRVSPQLQTISQPVAAQQPVEASSSEKVEVIKSPTPGTFYGSTGPDSEPYVKVGSEVEPQTKVCIIEAMKVMNEVNAEITGTIVEILVENGQAVEYGTPLFKVKPK